MHDKNKVGQSCDIIAPLLFTLCVFLLVAAIPTIHTMVLLEVGIPIFHFYDTYWVTKNQSKLNSNSYIPELR
jgi:hypothetical protein